MNWNVLHMIETDLTNSLSLIILYELFNAGALRKMWSVKCTIYSEVGELFAYKEYWYIYVVENVIDKLTSIWLYDLHWWLDCEGHQSLIRLWSLFCLQKNAGHSCDATKLEGTCRAGCIPEWISKI